MGAGRASSATGSRDLETTVTKAQSSKKRAEPKAPEDSSRRPQNSTKDDNNDDGDANNHGSGGGETTVALAPGWKAGKGGTTYKLVESGAFEIADHTSDRVRPTPVPKELIATVTFPPKAVSGRRFFLEGFGRGRGPLNVGMLTSKLVFFSSPVFFLFLSFIFGVSFNLIIQLCAI